MKTGASEIRDQRRRTVERVARSRGETGKRRRIYSVGKTLVTSGAELRSVGLGGGLSVLSKREDEELGEE